MNLAISCLHNEGSTSLLLTMFTCDLFELLLVKQDVKRKKEESPNSLPKNKSTTMMLTAYFLSTLK